MPSRHWDDVVATTAYLINRMPSKVLHFQTPLQTLSSHTSLPTVLMLPPWIFGCVAFVHLHKNQRTKLDLCAIGCLFLVYALHQKRYRCFDLIIKQTYITMDVTFLDCDDPPNARVAGRHHAGFVILFPLKIFFSCRVQKQNMYIYFWSHP